MLKTEYKVIGVMSGTSLDGVDLVYATFNYNIVWQFSIHFSITVSYDKYWLEVLSNLVTASQDELVKIDKDYTIYLANIILSFIKKHKIKTMDAVCSHGHTALHQPENGLTYQIGNLSEIATLLNEIVVCDFRIQDVDSGGQGAPLVPIGDKLLFSQYDYCLNLGGFTNVSTDVKHTRIAFDICAVNIVLNHYVKQLGFDFDNEGKIASAGNINSELLYQLNELNFYKLEYPKSLGLEWVNENIFQLIDAFKLSVKDILRTYVEHIALQISKEINIKNNASILFTGGGVYNLFLIKTIQKYSKNEIVIPSKEIIEYKEALIFAFLGVLKLRNEVNCLRSVTGSKKDHSSGKVFKP